VTEKTTVYDSGILHAYMQFLPNPQLQYEFDSRPWDVYSIKLSGRFFLDASYTLREFESHSWRDALDATLRDKVCQ
jgi:hypothetical protein